METNIRNKCKAYTSLEQSKKLAKFLPLESADMYYHYIVGVDSYYDKVPKYIQVFNHFIHFNNDIPCWSFAALLSVIPYNVTFNKAVYRFKLVKFSDHWECYHENFGTVSTEIFKADNPVDACVEMILKLNEQNLL